MRGLTGKVAMVTGGGRGIGAATARRLSEEGCRLVIVDRDGDVAQETASALPGEAIAVRCDVADEADVARSIAEAVAAFGRIDLFHLNAGIGGDYKPISEAATDDYDRVMGINLRGVFFGLRDAVKLLRGQGGGGAIVVTSSTGGLVGGELIAAYHGAKHGVIGLMKSAAMHGARFGIRANAVAPGMVDTEMGLAMARTTNAGDRGRRAQIATIPLDRPGSVDEIASVVAFLLSNDSSYMTGQVLVIDGGSMSDHPRARALSRLAEGYAD